MMDWGAKYAGFVIAAYAVSFTGIALMAAFVLYRDRQMKRELGRTRPDAERALLSDVEAPARRNGWLTALPVAGFAILAVLLYRGLSGNPSEIPSVLIDKPAPEFTLAPLRGSGLPGLATADLKGDKPTLVNVWASWCEPCRAEHPLLMQLSKRADVRVVGIAYKDEPENALKFLDGMGQSFAAIGVDADGRVGVDWGVYGVPETYLVDGQGIIRYKWIGAINAETIRAQIDPKIAEMGKGK